MKAAYLAIGIVVGIAVGAVATYLYNTQTQARITSLGAGMYILEEAGARWACTLTRCEWVAYYPKPQAADEITADQAAQILQLPKEPAEPRAAATGINERRGIESLIRPSK